MKIITIIGARPQFVKASVVSKEIRNFGSIKEIIVHTGQHFNQNMSDVFFSELGIPSPCYNLGINSGTHGEMTGKMIIEIETVLLQEKPNLILLYGDTNSTLAGAMAASKLHIPIAHVEAGLRSFNMLMPEEINRILTDQLSTLLFCPTEVSVNNLLNEGFKSKKSDIVKVGDVMQDAAMLFAKFARKPYNIEGNAFILSTLHRAENTDNPERLASIIAALNTLHKEVAKVIVPLHPRTRQKIELLQITVDFEVIEPVGYLEMIWLIQNSALVITDSGGLQKEAFFYGKKCITTRDQTEWTELVDVGANTLVGADGSKLIKTAKQAFGKEIVDNKELYGGGDASKKIVRTILDFQI